MLDGEQLEGEIRSSAIDDVLIGRLADGARWSIAGMGPLLAIGMPERSAVSITTLPSGYRAIEPLFHYEYPDEAFGTSLAVVDSDGDGLPELWVGAPDARAARGVVYRFPLGAEAPDLRIVGINPADALGSVVVGCADLTGDGLPEVAIGAPRLLAPPDPSTGTVPRLAGGVTVVLSERLRPGEMDLDEVGPTWWSDERAAGAGWAMSCSTDLTGDGRADLAIGAPFVGPDDEGIVYIREGGALGSGGPLGADDPWTLHPPPGLEGRFGSALVGVDRYLVVGAPANQRGRGAVGIIGPSGPDLFAVFRGPRGERAHFGTHVTSGDTDGDGAWDLWIGAPYRPVQSPLNPSRIHYDAGTGWLWRGAGRARWPLGVEADASIVGVQPFARVGRATLLHDFDGDGRDTLLQPTRAPDPGFPDG